MRVTKTGHNTFTYNDLREEDREILSWSLLKHLRQSVVVVDFTKVDGSHRTMRCTTDEKRIPENKIPKAQATGNKDVPRVFDVEKQEWRSFRLDNVVGFVTMYE